MVDILVKRLTFLVVGVGIEATMLEKNDVHNVDTLMHVCVNTDGLTNYLFTRLESPNEVLE